MSLVEGKCTIHFNVRDCCFTTRASIQEYSSWNRLSVSDSQGFLSRFAATIATVNSHIHASSIIITYRLLTNLFRKFLSDRNREFECLSYFYGSRRRRRHSYRHQFVTAKARGRTMPMMAVTTTVTMSAGDAVQVKLACSF